MLIGVIPDIRARREARKRAAAQEPRAAAAVTTD
jgi:hypothetical protein